jgi:hypothetical protein
MHVNLALCRSRSWLFRTAGPIAAAGTLAMMGWAMITMGVDPAFARNPNRAAMVSLYHDASNSADVAPNIILMGLMMLALFIANGGAGQWVASALFLVGMGGIGLTVLGRRDEDWARGAMPAAEPPVSPEAPAAATA